MKNIQLILIGSGLTVVILAGGFYFFSGSKGKPITAATVPNETKSDSAKGTETEKPANVENTHGLPFQIDTTDYSAMRDNELSADTNDSRIKAGILRAKKYVALGKYKDAGDVLASQMISSGYSRTEAIRAGSLLKMMCEDTMAEYIGVNLGNDKVYIKVVNKDLKSYANGYRNLNTKEGEWNYDGIDKDGNKL